MEHHDYECDIEMLKNMLGEPDELVLVFGNVGDNSALLPLFNKVFLLRCLPKTQIERLKTRDTNSFGKDESTHERISAWTERFNKIMLNAGAVPVSTDDSLEVAVENITNNLKA